MRNLGGVDYSAEQLSAFLLQEAEDAVDYILSVIADYDHTNHYSEHFSDVTRFDSYVHESRPKGDKKASTYGRLGIYVFVAKDSFHLSGAQVQQYNKADTSARFGRVRDYDIPAGTHFYQGSASSNSLLVRFRHHFEMTQVGGLKLNHPNRTIVKDHLYLYAFPVVKSLNEYPFFIKMIEKALHNRRRPMMGTTRT